MNQPREQMTATAWYLTLARLVWHGRCSLDWAIAQAETNAAGPFLTLGNAAELAERATTVSRWSPWRGLILAELAYRSLTQSASVPASTYCTLVLAEAKSAWGDWNEALILFEEALAGTIGDDQGAFLGRCLLGKAQSYQSLNRFEEADALVSKAREAFRAWNCSSGLADCDLLCACIHRARGDYTLAGQFALAAYEAYVRYNQTIDAALTQVELAYIAVCEQRYECAEALLAAAEAILVPDGLVTQIAWCRRVRALLELERGQYRAALAALKATKRIYEQERMASALRNCDRNIANVYRIVGRHEEALTVYSRLREEFAGLGMVVDAANCDMNIALVHKEQGQFRLALEFFQRAAETCVALDMPLHAARCRANMAIVEEVLGAYDRAMEELERARELFAAAGMALNVAQCDQDLARVHLALNQPDQASILLENAQQTFRAQEAELLLAASHIYLAEVRQAQGLPDTARTLLAEATTVYTRHQMEGHAALCLLRLAEVEHASGLHLRAVDHYQQARSEFVMRRWSFYAALCELGLGNAILAQGEIAEATEWLTDALAILEPDFPAQVCQAQHALALCRQRQGQPAEALKHYRLAIEAARRARGGIGTAKDSGTFFASHRAVYEEALTLALQLGASDQGIEILEAGKAQAYIALVYAPLLTTAQVRATDRLVDDLLYQARALQERIDHLESGLRLPGEPTRLAREPATLHYDEIIDSLGRARGAYERVIARLIRSRSLWAPVARPPAFACDRFCESIRSVWAGPWSALAYFVAGSRLSVLSVGSGGVQAWSKQMDPVEERLLHICASQKLEYRAHAYQANIDGYDVTHGNSKAILRRLHALLLPAEIQEQLAPAGLLIVSPHGILHNLPFGALQGPDGTHLLEQATVVYTPSLHMFQVLAERSAGDPSNQEGAPGLIVGVSEFGNRAPPLPAAVAEARAVHSLLGAESTLCLEEAAQKAFLLSMNKAGELRSYRILHFATHTLFNENSPLNTRLMLSDGTLALPELFDLALDADLVTLSSCEGARSELHPGDEMVGMTQALFHAGARAVIAGLWKVPDQSTSVLMMHLYESLLQGQLPAQALRAAQMQMAAHGYPPFAWAPFVFLGLPGRVRLHDLVTPREDRCEGSVLDGAPDRSLLPGQAMGHSMASIAVEQPEPPVIRAIGHSMARGVPWPVSSKSTVRAMGHSMAATCTVCSADAKRRTNTNTTMSDITSQRVIWVSPFWSLAATRSPHLLDKRSGMEAR